ncbi:unnamed protein product [Eruca vesicaria subsp. sativa]|uniref:Uncharacterized protein n=1 Tax=Eruca vesicaria subsp. sativa TaxID=29727 RepID=A0ABC8JKN3_ERUVS|nr:unnamed protein product [Eruca vesicaria subsp. sativa]
MLQYWMKEYVTKQNNRIFLTHMSFHRLSQNSLNDILHHTGMYYIVNGSWKSPAEKAGIGWSLFSREGIPRLHGSSEIDPTTSPFIAEVRAMLSAVQQLRTCTCLYRSGFFRRLHGIWTAHHDNVRALALVVWLLMLLFVLEFKEYE